MKFICIGDSFTFGPGVAPDVRWTSLLSEISRHEFINRGISGDTTSGMLARLRQDVIEDKPAFALIIGGTNDLIVTGGSGRPADPGTGGSGKDIIKNNLMAMIHQLFAAGIRPILASPIPCVPDMIPKLWQGYRNFNTLNSELSDLNSWMEAFSAAFLCGYLDLFTPMTGALADPAAAQALYLDGLHLTPAGHRFIADVMKEQLGRYLR